ncbi:MAG: DUF2274 domain-containing protein [Polaromonas sp.]|nr:DUF2274 domain-containing protein [Polaromonas sp.]
MSGKMLRLGPLPRRDQVKITLSLPLDLKEALDQYAALHSQLHGQHIEADSLIPHMLRAFIERDRGFRARRSTVTAATPGAS